MKPWQVYVMLTPVKGTPYAHVLSTWETERKAKAFAKLQNFPMLWVREVITVRDTKQDAKYLIKGDRLVKVSND